MKLTRKARQQSGGTRYWHAGGFWIRQQIRDWDARPYRGSVGNPTSKITWAVHDGSSSKYLRTFDLLRDARVWCDEQAGSR